MNQIMISTLQVLKEGVVQFIGEDELRKKLEKNESLIIKFGMDPTSPNLHLGHVPLLLKLRALQDLGHTAVLLIGDFTARIGDPTGKNKTRPPLSSDDITHNMATYLDQVGKILNFATMRVVYNSAWLAQLTFSDILALCARVTVARIIEREDFANRLSQKTAIGMHELLYPLMQGYDSVELRADVELGGTDQTFNLMMGRTLQDQYGYIPQAIVTMPLLEGLDGTQKMSKSLGNSIGLCDDPSDVYGKLMSLPDTGICRYFELLLNTPKESIKTWQEQLHNHELHPMVLKKQLAYAIVDRFWGNENARAAQSHFESIFQKRDYNEAKSVSLSHDTQNPILVGDLLKILNLVQTSSEVRRLVESGSIAIDGNKITDFKAMFSWQYGMVIKVGKHRLVKIV